jgi:hypothetical protein
MEEWKFITDTSKTRRERAPKKESIRKFNHIISDATIQQMKEQYQTTAAEGG